MDSHNNSKADFTKLYQEYELYPDDAEHVGEDFAQAELEPSESTTESTLGESEILPILETTSEMIRNKFGFGDAIPQDVLTKDMLQCGISFTGSALGTMRFAYTKLEVLNKNLRHIDLISDYVHLRCVNLSGNQISNIEPLAALKYLQVLNMEGNKISSVDDIPPFAWLQALNLSRNDVSSLNGFHPNQLSYLKLSNNQLTSDEMLTGDIFPNLLLLELRENSLRSIRNLELPKLRHLYIATNFLTSLAGIQNCPCLELIHARHNRISKLEGFPNLEKLKYINLRANRVSRFTQTIHLGRSPHLETVVLAENMIASSERYRPEICAAVLSIKRLDKTPVTEAELVEGRLLRSGREKKSHGPLTDDENVLSIPDELAGEYEE